MPGTGVVLRGTVVHGGEIVELVLHGVGGDAVGHLCGSVVVQRRCLGNHPAKQHHVHGRIFIQRILIGTIVLAVFCSQFCQRHGLCLSNQQQCRGVIALFPILFIAFFEGNSSHFQRILGHLFQFFPILSGKQFSQFIRYKVNCP